MASPGPDTAARPLDVVFLFVNIVFDNDRPLANLLDLSSPPRGDLPPPPGPAHAPPASPHLLQVKVVKMSPEKLSGNLEALAEQVR